MKYDRTDIPTYVMLKKLWEKAKKTSDYNEEEWQEIENRMYLMNKLLAETKDILGYRLV